MAFYWWHKAAIQDDPKSQYMVGYAYAIGVGVNKDLKESAIWIRKAYDNGLEQAKQFWEENELWKY